MCFEYKQKCYIQAGLMKWDPPWTEPPSNQSASVMKDIKILYMYSFKKKLFENLLTGPPPPQG